MAMSDLEFFDCNCIVGPLGAIHPEANVSIEELRSRMRELGIRRLLVTHSYSIEYDPTAGNQAVSEVCQGTGDLVPCYVLVPPATHEQPPPGDGLLTYLRQGGARAVRLDPKTHSFGLGELWCGEIFACLSEAGVPVFVDFDQTNWIEVDSVLRDHPGLELVILRAGYRIDRWVYPLLERHPGLHLEVSWYHAFGGIEALTNRFGADRLLFGTGAPFWEPAGAIGLITYADLPEEDKALIASGNLERLLWKGLQNG
jgi:predicted TIM-barrel fold metal-dependent hydrolase